MSEKTPERNNVSMTMETFCFYDEFLLRYLSFVMVKKMLRVWKILPHSTIFNINVFKNKIKQNEEIPAAHPLPDAANTQPHHHHVPGLCRPDLKVQISSGNLKMTHYQKLPDTLSTP